MLQHRPARRTAQHDRGCRLAPSGQPPVDRRRSQLRGRAGEMSTVGCRISCRTPRSHWTTRPTNILVRTGSFASCWNRGISENCKRLAKSACCTAPHVLRKRRTRPHVARRGHAARTCGRQRETSAHNGLMPQVAIKEIQNHPQRPPNHRSPSHEDNPTQHGANRGASHHQVGRSERRQEEIRHHKKPSNEAKLSGPYCRGRQPTINNLSMTDIYKKINHFARRFYTIL